MRPTGEELLRGLQAGLLTYVLPEVQSDHARLQLMLTYALLGIAASEWDGAAQRLAGDNAALRALAARAATQLPDGASDLAGDLRALAAGADSSLRISDLSAANAQLRDAVGRLGVLLEGRDGEALQTLRAELIDLLRADAEARDHHVLGPRADG